MWQPIETAPKDQTFLAVLNCAGQQTICTMRWAVAEEKNSRPDHGVFHVERVTHWMPLPDLPGAQPAPSVPDGRGYDNQPVQRFVGRRNAQEREPAMQDALMKFDPATGEERPYPSHATQWRNWHGIAAWLFDPWTGRRRNAHDVGSDVHGLLIEPAGTLGMDMGGGCAEAKL
jgi:hypothetical protein